MSRFFPSRHLDSPIIDVNLNRASNIIDHACRARLLSPTLSEKEKMVPDGTSVRDRGQIFRIAEVLIKSTSLSGNDLSSLEMLEPYMYPSLWNHVTLPAERVGPVIKHAYSAVAPILASAMRAMSDKAGGESVTIDLDALQTESLESFCKEEAWAIHIEKYVQARNEGRRDPFVSIHSHSKMIISQALCILEVDLPVPDAESTLSRRFFLTYEQLLMLRDCAMMRKNALTAARVIYPDDPLLPTLMKESFLWQELVLSTYGNPGYEIAKATEALAKTYMSRVAGDILAGPGDDFDQMMVKFRAKETKLRRATCMPAPSATFLVDVYFDRVLSPCTAVQQVSELFGLQKFCGHPLIDPYVSGIKSAAIAREQEKVMPSNALDLVNTFKKLFVEGFIRRHSRWPSCSFSASGSVLEQLYTTQTLSLNRQTYPKAEWALVTFGKELDIEVYDNYLDLIDDKAISMYLHEKHLQWDEGTPTSSRRLLVELLRRPSFSVAEVIEKVERDDIPLHWLICSLFPKEREFKLAARMFVMLVMEMRTFFAAHEANIATQILPYLPQITMTDDKLAVHRRFLDLTAPLTSADVIRFFLELDLSSWNLRWRAVTVNPIGQCLNDLFGLIRMFTSAHEFFEKACIMVRVQGCRPDGIECLHPPESDLCWKNHRGGFEGIIQKLWSIATVCMIERALEGLPIKYSLTDQGDNIVVVVTAGRDYSVTEVEQIKTLRADILARCEKSASEVNQELKPEESLASTSVLTYSKVVYVNGVDYPTICKYMSRTMPSSAVDFPSYSAYIQAIFAGSYAAAETCKTPLRCWVLALLQASYFITRTAQYQGAYHHALLANNHLQTEVGIRYQLLWPSELGGLPITGLYAFLYKGGGDPLSKSLASLKLLQNHSREVRGIIGLSLDPALYEKSPKLFSLLQDPYGLPITKPVAPEEAVARDTLSVVTSITQNQDIKDVLVFASQAYSDELVGIIKGLSPFNPVVARDLLDCSALGSVDTIKRMFLKTRTLQTIAREYEDSDLVTSLISAGSAQIHFLGRMIPALQHYSHKIDSLYLYVESLRRHWAPSGVTIQALTSYLPIDFDIVWDPPASPSGILIELRAGAIDIQYQRGSSPPYLGTSTKAKRAEHGYKIVGTGYALSALRSLQAITTWAKGDQGVTKLVDYLSRSRCGLNLSTYSPLLSSVIGGDQGHRYEARIGERDAHILGLTSVASFCVLSSNRAGYLSASTEDYPIMFQEHFLYLISMIHERWMSTGRPGFIRAVLKMGDQPLHHLPLESLSLPDMILPAEIPPTLRLVQSQGISISQTGGPFWHSDIRLHTCSPQSLLFPALISELHRALGVSNRTMGLLGSASSAISPRFGILEVLGMGVKTLLDAAAIVIVESALGIMRSKIFGPKVNVGMSSLVQRFGSALAKGLYPLLCHPDLQGDSEVLRLGIGPGPRYGSPLHPIRRLLGELSMRVANFVTNPNSLYYKTETVVFGSEDSSPTLTAAIRLLRKRALQALAAGLITQDDAEFIIGSTIRRMSSSLATDEPSKLDKFHELLLSYSAYRRGKTLVSAEANRIAVKIAMSEPGSQILATMRGAEEFIRHYRFLSRSRITLPALRPPRVSAMYSPQSSAYTARGGSLFLSDSQRVIFAFERAWGSPLAWGSGAAETWLQVSELFKGVDVVIVGSGLGAAAASAGIGGAKTVWGHDLATDFPTDVSLSEYRPPLVRLLAPKTNYVQTTSTLSTSGDWFNEAVSHSLCNMTSAPHILVVDISSKRGGSVEALWPVIRCGFPYQVAFRSTTTLYGHAAILGVLEHCTSSLAVLPVHTVDYAAERVYWFTLRGSMAPFVPTPRQLRDCRDSPRLTKPRTVKALLAYVLAPLGGATGTTVRLSLITCLSVLSDMMTSSYTKPSYDEWTSILQSAVACEWLLLYTKDEQLMILRQMELTGLYTLASHPTLMIQAPLSLRLHLAKVVSRLSACLDDRVV